MKMPDKSQFLFYSMMQKTGCPDKCWEHWQKQDPRVLLNIAKTIKTYKADPKSFVFGWDYFDTVADAQDYAVLAELTDIEQKALVGETYEKHMRRNRDPYLTFAKTIRPNNQYEARVEQASKRIQEFYKANNLIPGRLVPDAIKFSDEYQKLKKEYVAAFAELRAYNTKQLRAAKEKSGRLTTSQVNKAINHTGLAVERIKDGYFIFVDKKTKNSIDAPSVMVNRVWDLPLQEWVDIAEDYATKLS